MFSDAYGRNVFAPAQEQFDGSGSYGNGAAMRAAPIALFAQSQQELVEVSMMSSVVVLLLLVGIAIVIILVWQWLHSCRSLPIKHSLPMLILMLCAAQCGKQQRHDLSC